MRFTHSISTIEGIGEKTEKRLGRLGIETVGDLLWHLPFRYEDYSQIVPISAVHDGQQVTIRGKIELIANRRSGRRGKTITEALVSDESGQMKMVWFSQPFVAKTLKQGDDVYFSGTIKDSRFGLQMVSPTFEKQSQHTKYTGKIDAIYPLTAGLTQRNLATYINKVMSLAKEVEDWLPEELRKKAKVVHLGKALEMVHQPKTREEMQLAKRRFAFDELLKLQLRARIIRDEVKKEKGPEVHFFQKETKNFVDQLPFTLTDDQKKAAWQILQDMEESEPMNRLLEGDVGSGKTVVASVALLNIVKNNLQGVFMAPTEILAVQHYETILSYLKEDAKIGILTRSRFEIFGEDYSNLSKKKQKQAVIDALNAGTLDIVIGTHALLNDDITIKHLGLVIVDEQHRFGVEQRKTIRSKSASAIMPHFLSMTATPIPRSFALTVYGDLDLSIIREKPKNRLPIETKFVSQTARNDAYTFIAQEIEKGRQAFVICPLVGDKETLTNDKKSVLEEYEKLNKVIFPDLRVGYLHGKMKAKEKEETMKKFAGGEMDILVSTSVIEVGIDVPNATVMMIEGADRFGLAQLHQFRGRVGRSGHQSYCFLFTDSDSEKVQERLAFFEDTNDGFAVAEYDLSMRGPGDVYGTTQSGLEIFKFASMQDAELISLAREMAKDVDFGEFTELKAKAEEWAGGVHLE